MTREGVVGLVGALFLCTLFFAVHWTKPALGILGLGILWAVFCRHPRRHPASLEEEIWLAPADGKVVEVTELPDGRTRIGIFMRVWDVHVNRAPYDGEVWSILHRRGRFRPAFQAAAVRENEQARWTFRSPRGIFEMVQIAGILARRIRIWVQPGQWVRKTAPVGMILLGSRVDVYLPTGVKPLVSIGTRVRAGETMFARWEV